MQQPVQPLLRPGYFIFPRQFDDLPHVVLQILLGQFLLKRQQSIHIGAQDSGQRTEQHNIRTGTARFPFTHRRTRHPQRCRKLLLGHPPCLAQRRDFCSHFLFHKFTPTFPLYVQPEPRR